MNAAVEHVVNAPTRLAALIAIRDALDVEIKAEKLETLAFAGEFGVKKSFDTPLGPVTVASKDGAVGWDGDGLLAWVKAHYPSEVEQTERVRPAFQSVLQSRFVAVAGEVVDSVTGEQVDFEPVEYGECHHRRLRSRGGRDTAWNCIWLCNPCHQWVHAHPAEATRLGLIVPSWAEPAVWPVLRRTGWYQPSPGAWLPAEPREEQVA